MAIKLLRNLREILPLLSAELGPDAAFRFLRKHHSPQVLTAEVLRTNLAQLQKDLVSSKAEALDFMTRCNIRQSYLACIHVVIFSLCFV